MSAQILYNPTFQQILIAILGAIGPTLFARREEIKYEDPVAEKIDALIEELKRQPCENKEPVAVEETEKTSESGAQHSEQPKEQHGDTGHEVASVTVQTENGPRIWNVVSTPPADRPVATACLPCTRAHLIGVTGDLEEAVRMARTRGVNDPEVVERIDAAAKELVTLERFDLSPDKIQKLPPEEKEVVTKVLPRIRDLRQRVLNEITTVEDLEKLAAEAADTYRQVRQLSAAVKPISY